MPVQLTAPVPQGKDTAVTPLQFQPSNSLGEIVGYIVGAKAVGDTEEDAEKGEREGAAVGFDGQFVIPSLNAQRAFASDICWADAVGKAVGANVDEFATRDSKNDGAEVRSAAIGRGDVKE